MPRALAVAAFALLLAAAAAPAADAATVTRTSTTVTVTARNGELNNLLIEQPGTGIYRITDVSAPLTASAPCTQITTNRVTCSTSGITLVRVLAGDGADRVEMNGSTKAELRGGTGIDFLAGGSGNDTLAAGATGVPTGFDFETLEGRGGVDTLYGSTSTGVNDLLSGGPGNDKLRGGPAHDVLVGNEGADDMTGGGGGSDTASYSDKATGVTVTVNDVANDGLAGEGDNVHTDVGTISGSPGDDTLTGSTAADLIYGNGGNDTINGASGRDVVYSGPGDDTLNGGADADILYPSVGTDTISGGTGTDMASYNDFFDATAITASLDGTANDGPAGENDFVKSDVENLEGGPGNDTLSGNAVANRIVGNQGTDTINGFGGDDDLFGDGTYSGSGGAADTLNGGAGQDLLTGGTGPDVVSGGADFDLAPYADRSAKVTVTLDGAAGDGEAGEGDNVKGDVEGVLGSPYDDVLTGSAYANNVLIGGGGNDQLSGLAGNDTLGGDETNIYVTGTDVLSGGGGIDTVTYDMHNSPLTLDLDGVADDGQTGENDRIKTDVENLIGGNADDHITGNERANALFGGRAFGADTVTGAGGPDSLTGGSGPDTLDGGAGDDELDSHGDAYIDTSTCGADTDRLLADTADNANPDCETVTTVPTASGASAASAARTAAARDAARAARRRLAAVRRMMR
ncbi:MAG TPA: calcium-binding protein [Solirubrobacteraceae bacterium]|jgi:Ca2+-binding RTX toxin-like protein